MSKSLKNFITVDVGKVYELIYSHRLNFSVGNPAEIFFTATPIGIHEPIMEYEDGLH